MHDLAFDHEHEAALTDAERRAIARSIVEQDTLELLTVGIDIGSSTSHLLFARVLLEREARELSSRFRVVDRQVVARSRIVLTPFHDDGRIDLGELGHFVRRSYASAGIRPSQVDSGAVILTGEAARRPNARAVDEWFAARSGAFVCATAGHRLEATLAAHGSGATRISQERGVPVLHLDIGGGTSKLAMIEDGSVRSVAAVAVGGRLVARDRARTWTRVDDAARLVADAEGIDTAPPSLADPAVRAALADRLADLLVEHLVGEPGELARALELTPPLERTSPPQLLTVSGGVAEYLFGHEERDHGDIARELARAVAARLDGRVGLPVVEPRQRIRATVIGASQFTVQVSGKTIHLGAGARLPLHHLPVVHLAADLPDRVDPGAVAAGFEERARLHDRDPAGPLALAITWSGPPTHRRLVATARGIARFAGTGEEPLVVVVDGDVAQSLGRLLEREVGLRRPLVCVDGAELTDLDVVDLGEPIDPPGVVPMVIKSLLFG